MLGNSHGFWVELWDWVMTCFKSASVHGSWDSVGRSGAQRSMQRVGSWCNLCAIYSIFGLISHTVSGKLAIVVKFPSPSYWKGWPWDPKCAWLWCLVTWTCTAFYSRNGCRRLDQGLWAPFILRMSWVSRECMKKVKEKLGSTSPQGVVGKLPWILGRTLRLGYDLLQIC